MTDRFVFDTEALIAFLYDEPGHESVARLLKSVFEGSAAGYVDAINVSEVFYLVARFEGEEGSPTDDSLRIADRDVRALERRGLGIERANWRLVGEIKADGHISIADAHAVALAKEQDATLVAGGDDDFESLPVDIDIERFRENGV